MAHNFTRQYNLTGKGQADDDQTEEQQIGGTFSLVATLDVIAVNGATGTLIVKLQHSPDNSNWYDLAAMVFATTSVVGDETIEKIDGAIYPYVRADYEITAGDRTFDFNVHMVGRSG